MLSVTHAVPHVWQPRRHDSAASVMQKSTSLGSVAEYGCIGVYWVICSFGKPGWQGTLPQVVHCGHWRWQSSLSQSVVAAGWPFGLLCGHSQQPAICCCIRQP